MGGELELWRFLRNRHRLEQYLIQIFDRSEYEEAHDLFKNVGPTFDVNWKHPETLSAWLHDFDVLGYDKTLKLFLSHPHLDVNPRTPNGVTPFMKLCAHGRGVALFEPKSNPSTCLSLLLEDPRLDMNQVDSAGKAGVFLAMEDENYEFAEIILASLRRLPLSMPAVDWDKFDEDSTEDNFYLWKQYEADAFELQKSLRVKLKVQGSSPSFCFKQRKKENT